MSHKNLHKPLPQCISPLHGWVGNTFKQNIQPIDWLHWPD